MADFSNESVIKEFREDGGKVGGYFEGLPLLLLTTTGAKSGKTHVSPMIYLDDGGRIHVFASKAGAPTSPGWYHNLVANPEVTVEVGGESFQAKATVLPDPARGEVYSKQAALLPQFAEYETEDHPENSGRCFRPGRVGLEGIALQTRPPQLGRRPRLPHPCRPRLRKLPQRRRS